MTQEISQQRRWLLGGAAALALAPALAPSLARAQPQPRPARAPLAPPVKVSVGIISAMFDAISLIAFEQGYFREEGLDVEIKAFPGSGEAAQALAIGAIDALASGPNPMIFNSRQRNIELSIVASAGQHSPGHGSISLVMRRDLVENGRYKSPADLKGMKIASGLAAPSSWFVSELARGAGVGARDVELIQLGLPNVVAGLGNKSIDAGCINEPHATQVLKRVNGVRIMSMDQFRPNFPNGYLVFTAALTRKNPEAGRRYMVAYMRALRDYRDAFIVRKRDGADLRAMLLKYNMVLLPDTPMVDLPADGQPSFVAVDELVEWHLKMGNIRNRPDLAALTNDSFRRYALQELGGA
jgi:NitT/TauT family transport system substrate-binding protein